MTQREESVNWPVRYAYSFGFGFCTGTYAVHGARGWLVAALACLFMRVIG